MLPATLSPLQDQLLAAARALSPDAASLGELLVQLAADVDRVMAEPLHILPVCHHSPSSAVHLVRRLQSQPPKVIFIEMCEDLIGLVAELPSCSPPIAMQAFAADAPAFPERWAPLNLVAPFTPFSAEFQAIAYALRHPETELVFVDRSADHVFQWIPREREEAEDEAPTEPDEEAARLHGGAVGVELGALLPSFPEFVEVLLGHSRVSTFAEWWSLYVDEPTIGADHPTWRQVMVLIGSLIRRLGSKTDRLEVDRNRERYMWTRMKQHLARRGLAPQDAVYICGAAHAASDVAEWGTAALGTPEDVLWEIPERTNTHWQYGFIPSSYSAIEHQFSHPRGTISLAEQSWTKALSALSLSAYTLRTGKKSDDEPKKPRKKKLAPEPEPTEGGLAGVLQRPPSLLAEDHEQLLDWCTRIVGLARENHYLASTADAIAIYQTALLLARLRGRHQPSPYDFVDAAETCLDKGDVARRSVRQLCGTVLGGDRIGKVGYSTLPPLVRDLYDRLAVVGVTPGKTTITRALMDLKARPELRPVSDLLWRLRYLLPGSDAARPIMGERRLGVASNQESWDIRVAGPALRDVIELSYLGVSVEGVLERRILEAAFKPEASAATALALAEDSLLYTHRERLTGEVGERAVALLSLDRSAVHAREVFERVRRLVHYCRATPAGLPPWLKDFVATGYQHYSALLPEAFGDRGTSPEQLSGMLAFVFSLESLALSLGCQRSQLVIAIQQAEPLTTDPGKLGLLWAAQILLELRSLDEIRARFAEILDNPMSLAALPPLLGSLLLALSFTPLVASLCVEMLSRAFMELPDAILLPWLPGLLDALRPLSGDLVPALVREVVALQPRDLKALDGWVPEWERGAEAGAEGVAPGASGAAGPVMGELEAAAFGLVREHRGALEGWAGVLGVEGVWGEVRAGEGAGARSEGAASPAASPAASLIARWPAAVGGWREVLG